MRAKRQRLLHRAFWKIMCGVITLNRHAIIGQLRVRKLIHFSGSAASTDSRNSSAENNLGGAIGTFDGRATVCHDGPRRPFPRLVGGGFAASVRDIDWRA